MNRRLKAWVYCAILIVSIIVGASDCTDFITFIVSHIIAIVMAMWAGTHLLERLED